VSGDTVFDEYKGSVKVRASEILVAEYRGMAKKIISAR
jgi:hypothetical protein